MSEIKVNSIKGIGASSAAITVNNSDGTATANLTTVNSVTMPNGGFLSNRNLIINGAMQVAQRGTSSTSAGYQTVDRFLTRIGGTDEAPTFAQVGVASGTTPYSLGFRKAFKVTNGNQTSGAGAGDYIQIIQRIEGQNVAQSGWNYVSSSSNITLSFWVKSSVAQNFYGYLRSIDGTGQLYPFETGSLSADTWTKVTKTIPGNSNLTFNIVSTEGLQFLIAPFQGTDLTASSVTLNQWAAYASGTRAPDYTSTWYTTNDATFEITGVQLEVGSVATDFEHRSFGQELALCQRYYYEQGSTFYGFFGYGTNSGVNQMGNLIRPVDMRANPTITYTTGGYWSAGPYAGGNGGYYSYVYGQTTSSNGPNLSNYQLDAEL